MPSSLKVAVIGTGSLGKEHVRIYAELARAGALTLAGVYDVDQQLARKVAGKYGTTTFGSIEEASERASAFSLVTPTSTHYAIGRDLLSAGKHVLIEKPITDQAAHAAELVRLASEKGCILQVGHVERFNPVFAYLEQVATHPRFIESHRLSPFPGRNTDIGVVLDLMIHDLDVILTFVRSPVRSVDAVGIAVLSSSEDIANARIRFANGCVANLTASRVSPERVRKIRVFSDGDPAAYVSLDYRAQEGLIYRIARNGEEETSVLRKWLSNKDSTVISEFAGKRIVREPVPIERDEPLKLEVESFIKCVGANETPRVSGEAGARALDLGLEITRQIQEQSPGARTSSSAESKPVPEVLPQNKG